MRKALNNIEQITLKIGSTTTQIAKAQLDKVIIIHNLSEQQSQFSKKTNFRQTIENLLNSLKPPNIEQNFSN